MSAKIIFIERRVRVFLENNYVVITGDDEKKIFLPDISTIIFESQQCSVTLAVLNQLVQAGVSVITCDARKFPVATLISFLGTASTYKKIKSQLTWSQDGIENAWQDIIIQKIANQRQILNWIGKNIDFPEVKIGDCSNAEGVFSAKYFKLLFGDNFQRHIQDDINIALNYGYTIILSALSRIIASHGYLLQIGIHHKGETNPFNLACDIVEPFRPVIDFIVYRHGGELSKEYKLSLIKSLTEKIRYKNKTYCLKDAMELYFLDVVSGLQSNKKVTGEMSLIV